MTRPGYSLNPASLRQRLRGDKISCSPWRIYRGVIREFCISAKCLFANSGVPYDVIEMELKSEGWLYENENLLDVLRCDHNLKRELSITDPDMDTYGAIPEDWTEDDYNVNF